MPPRRAQHEQRQNDLPPPSFPPCFASIVEEEVPFLQDDWWTSAPAAGMTHSRSLDSIIEPFLHYPDESQSTPMAICPGSTAAASAANPKPAPRRKEKGSVLGVDASGKALSFRESHVLSERERRKGMNHHFATLAALLPEDKAKVNLPRVRHSSESFPAACIGQGDKSTIVGEIILYIQSLQGDLEDLSKKQALRPKREATRLDSAPQPLHTTSTPMDSSLAPNVVVSVCGPDAFVTVSADRGHSLLARALTTLQQHRLQVLDGNISSSGSMMFYYFHAKVLNGFQVPLGPVQTALQGLTSSPSAAAST